MLLSRCASRRHRHRRRYPCDVSETGSGCVRPLSLPVRRVVVGGQIWRGGTKPSILWVGFHPLCRPCIVIMPSPSLLPPSWSCTYTRPPGEVTKCGVKAKPTPLRRPHVPQGERQGRQEAGIKTCCICSCSLARSQGRTIHTVVTQVFGGIQLSISLATRVQHFLQNDDMLASIFLQLRISCL